MLKPLMSIDNPPEYIRDTGEIDFDKLEAYVYSDEFVREHIGWMLNLSTSILLDQELSRDAVQTAFHNVYRSIRGFRGESELRIWLRQIAINESLNLLKKRKKEEGLSIEQLLPKYDAGQCRIGEPTGELTDVEVLANDSLVQREIFLAMAKLSDEYRIVLLLRDIEGFTTKEVAESLSVSSENVKVRLHRARSALKKLLEPILRPEGVGK